MLDVVIQCGVLLCVGGASCRRRVLGRWGNGDDLRMIFGTSRRRMCTPMAVKGGSSQGRDLRIILRSTHA